MTRHTRYSITDRERLCMLNCSLELKLSDNLQRVVSDGRSGTYRLGQKIKTNLVSLKLLKYRLSQIVLVSLKSNENFIMNRIRFRTGRIN
jgi:hypothetical protein